MILTDYYKFKRVATKSHTRMDCVASTHSYPPFENRRSLSGGKETATRDATIAGAIVAYYTDTPPTYKGQARRKAGKKFNIRNEHISSIYTPDPTSRYGYGDVCGTKDALLIVFKDLNTVNGVIQPDGEIEVFIARGESHNRLPLWNYLSDGGLDSEMNTLRAVAESERTAVEADSLY